MESLDEYTLLSVLSHLEIDEISLLSRCSKRLRCVLNEEFWQVMAKGREQTFSERITKILWEKWCWFREENVSVGLKERILRLCEAGLPHLIKPLLLDRYQYGPEVKINQGFHGSYRIGENINCLKWWLRYEEIYRSYPEDGPVLEAVKKNRLDRVECWMQLGSKCRRIYSYACYAIISEGKHHMAESILSKYPECRENWYKHGITHAADLEMLKILVKHGVLRTEFRWHPIVVHSVLPEFIYKPECLRFLLEHGFPVEDFGSESALGAILDSTKELPESLEILLKHGAQTKWVGPWTSGFPPLGDDSMGDEERSALHLAIIRGKIYAVNMLIDYGAEMPPDPHTLVCEGDHEMIKTLCEAGYPRA